MATQVKHRRGTDAEILAGTPAIGELWFNTTDNSVHMGDGVTQGGWKFSRDLSGFVAGDDGKKYKVVAGTLRNNAGTWEFLEDGAHTNTGGLSVTTPDDITLEINYNFTASKVISLQVDTDESYARLGLTASASVGQSSAQINGYLPMEYQIETDGSNAPVLTANSEIINRLTPSRSGFSMRVNHTGSVSEDAPQISPIDNAPTAKIDTISSTAINFTQYEGALYYYRLRYSSGWLLDSNDPSASLDSSSFTTNGSLVITTSNEAVHYVNTTMSHRYNEARLFSNAPGSMTIRFYDSSGVVIKTEANSTTECNIGRGAVKDFPNQSTTLPAGKYSVRRGKIPVYWAEITDTPSTGGNANLWVLGIFEVE